MLQQRRCHKLANTLLSVHKLNTLRTYTTAPSHHAPDGTFKYPDHWPLQYKPPAITDLFKFSRQMRNTTLPIPTQEQLPIQTVDLKQIHNPDPTKIQYTWIGHSTFLVQYNGVNILTDPVFSDRASVVQFMGPQRFRPVPCTIEQLPPIDVVTVSHNHYDHLDYFSIGELFRVHKNCTFYAPLKLGKWFSDNFNEIAIKELDWYNSAVHTPKQVSNIVTGVKKDVSSAEVEVTCLPSQHWSSRKGYDRNQTLWCSFGVKVSSKDSIAPKVIYHGGDTGYNNVCFKEIGEKYAKPNGGIDFAMIPIGAYEPRWFMKIQHCNVEEAVDIALDVQAKHAVAMHWGT